MKTLRGRPLSLVSENEVWWNQPDARLEPDERNIFSAMRQLLVSREMTSAEMEEEISAFLRLSKEWMLDKGPSRHTLSRSLLQGKKPRYEARRMMCEWYQSKMKSNHSTPVFSGRGEVAEVANTNQLSSIGSRAWMVKLRRFIENCVDERIEERTDEKFEKLVEKKLQNLVARIRNFGLRAEEPVSGSGSAKIIPMDSDDEGVLLVNQLSYNRLRSKKEGKLPEGFLNTKLVKKR